MSAWPRSIATFVLGLSLVGCGASADGRPPAAKEDHGLPEPVKGCEEFSYHPCDIRETDCQQELFRLTACVRNGDAEAATLTPPEIELLTPSEAAKLIADETERLGLMTDPETVRVVGRGLELIGLLEEGLIETQEDYVDLTVDALLGFYLDDAKRVVVVDRGEPVDDFEANIVLAHEFVHVMQDAEHDLASLDRRYGTEFDDQLALLALIEGEASLYETQVAGAFLGKPISGPEVDQAFEDFVAFGEEATLELGSPYATARGIFPYTHGAYFAAQAWDEGGKEAVDELFDSPPIASLQVLENTLLSEQLPELSRFDDAPEAVTGYELKGEDVLGAWLSFGLVAGLAQDLGLDWARDLALAWRGDRVWTYANADGSVAVVWRLEWANNDSAKDFAAALRKLSVPDTELRISTSETQSLIVAVERADDLQAWLEASAP